MAHIAWYKGGPEVKCHGAWHISYTASHIVILLLNDILAQNSRIGVGGSHGLTATTPPPPSPSFLELYAENNL